MRIAGLQKCTLLDYPGKVACTVFLPGCNFGCPFCPNYELIANPEELMEEAEFFSFLQKRRGLLQGVCVTGGEPTLQPELPAFLKKIRDLGYSVKLDTNGYRPEVLKALVEEGLVDYVAMDIKNSPDEYGKTVGLSKMDISRIEESIRFLAKGTVDYEFRTTVVSQLHSSQSIEDMGKWLLDTAGAPVKQLFLQPFVDRDTVMFAGLQAPETAQMAEYTAILESFAESVKIRGNG